jgi:hypothetical protein
LTVRGWSVRLDVAQGVDAIELLRDLQRWGLTYTYTHWGGG